LPEAHVQVTEAKGGFGNFGQNYGASRFDRMESFGSSYTTPGWQRAQARKARSEFDEDATNMLRRTKQSLRRPIEAAPRKRPAPHAAHHRGRTGGQVHRHIAVRAGRPRVHQKFGNGNVTHIDGNKLTIAFDRAAKSACGSFVERV